MKQLQKLAEQYNFNDFTESHYRKLIILAKQNYKFESYGTKIKSPHVLWRHDVDNSVHRALRLAQIEAELKVHATYFFMLHSEFYNILEKSIFEKIKQISMLGHGIGLHFDSGFYSPIRTLKELEDKLLFEKNILESAFSRHVTVFSFHIPEVGNILKFDNDRIGGMINTYGKKIRSNYGYCSDSTGYWRHRRLEDVLKAASETKLQVLTHPEWWQRKTMSPRERIERCIIGRAENTRNSYSKLLKKIRRKNIG